MDDNKAQSFQNSNDGQPDMEPQNYNPNIREHTYWESGQRKEGEAQTPEMPQTPEQFYQYYQQMMKGSSGDSQNNAQPSYYQPVNPAYQAGIIQPPNKKHHGALIAIITVILLLFSAAGVAYAFRDTLSNTLAKLTKSPAEYYAYIEKNELEKVIDKIKSTGDSLKNSTKSYEVTSDFRLNHDVLDPLLDSSLGMALSDLESELGIPLEKIGLDATVTSNGKIVNEAFGLRLKDAKLITAELFADITSGSYLLRLPELSPAFLNLSTAYEEINDLPYLKNLSSDTLSVMLQRYGNIAIDGVKQVEMDDSVEISIDTLSTKCTRLTITLSEKDAANILVTALEEARNDETIISLLPLMNLTKEEYQEAIHSTISDCRDTYASTDALMKMEVYVNSKGEIIKRSFASALDDSSLGYSRLSKGNLEEYRLYLTDEDGNEIINIEGSHRKNNQDAYTGDARFTYSDIYSDTSYRINISYDDYRSERTDNRIYQYGTIEVSSMDLMGIQVAMDFSVEDELQKCSIDFRMGAVSIVSADISAKYLDSVDVSMPSKDAKMYGAEDMESYIATIDEDAYLSHLIEQFGINLQPLIDYFDYYY